MKKEINSKISHYFNATKVVLNFGGLSDFIDGEILLSIEDDNKVYISFVPAGVFTRNNWINICITNKLFFRYMENSNKFVMRVPVSSVFGVSWK